MIEYTKQKIREALNLYKNRDWKELYSVDIYEPTISHRIGVYLERLFPEYRVDCEYDKHLFEGKECSEGKRIRPDIIVHKRKIDQDNLVIFEVKKSRKDSKLAKKDQEKLKDCIEKYGYKLGVFVGVLKKRIDVCWIMQENGRIVVKTEIL